MLFGNKRILKSIHNLFPFIVQPQGISKGAVSTSFHASPGRNASFPPFSVTISHVIITHVLCVSLTGLQICEVKIQVYPHTHIVWNTVCAVGSSKPFIECFDLIYNNSIYTEDFQDNIHSVNQKMAPKHMGQRWQKKKIQDWATKAYGEWGRVCLWSFSPLLSALNLLIPLPIITQSLVHEIKF